MKDMLVDEGKSPLENVHDEELRARVECELKALTEPYRTTVILRDIEELSYEQIAEVMDSLPGDGEVAAGARARGVAKTHGTSPAAFGMNPGVARQCQTAARRYSWWSEG